MHENEPRHFNNPVGIYLNENIRNAGQFATKQVHLTATICNYIYGAIFSVAAPMAMNMHGKAAERYKLILVDCNFLSRATALS
jgi:hypothetical protein